MLIREIVEQEEIQRLSPHAQLSIKTKGRAVPEDECVIRTCYQKDKDRILHSLSFRLLKYKTNVFLSTTGEKFHTRISHTLEVSQIARTIARALRLNEDLTEAIALGHDLGHTPFGHTGEEVLNKLNYEGFHHAEQSLRVVDFLEKEGRGLNLTFEVRDGIRKHTKGRKSIPEFKKQKNSNQPATLEGEIVQYSDWIAYINHDIDDAVEMKLITYNKLPQDAIKVLGVSHAQRIDTMVRDVIENSKNKIVMSDNIMESTELLRCFLYDKVYTMPEIIDEVKSAEEIITTLYRYYESHYDEILHMMPWLKNVEVKRGVTDYVAFLTDTQAQECYKRIKF